MDNGSTASYAYNALGERVEKDLSGTYTEYAFDKDGSPEAENNRGSSNGGWVDSWVNFEGQHLAHYENNGVYYIYSNQVGTAGVVTDWTGAVIQDELHYPWGKVWTTMGTQTEERFASLHHRDPGTNLDPTHFRMYSSDEARWLTPDPAQADIYNPQSMSRYAYAVNSPASLTDPSGLGCTSTSGANGKLTTVCTVTAQAGGYTFLGPFGGLSGYTGPSPLIYRPGGDPKGGCCRTQIGPAPPPNVGPAPKPPAPVHPGTASAYLECVASAGINMAFGNSDRFFATIGFNLAPIIFSGAPPAAITATFFAGVYDINLALRIRAICTKEVYGAVR